jgi:hypothetical protein
LAWRGLLDALGTALPVFSLLSGKWKYYPAARIVGKSRSVGVSYGFLRQAWMTRVQTKFIEMSGKTLKRIVTDHEFPSEALERLGVGDESMVRVNAQGDVELRRVDRWDAIGGLLGNFSERLRRETGLDWV